MKYFIEFFLEQNLCLPMHVIESNPSPHRWDPFPLSWDANYGNMFTRVLPEKGGKRRMV